MYVWTITLRYILLCQICCLILSIIWYSSFISHVRRVLGCIWRQCNICDSSICYILRNICSSCCIYNCNIINGSDVLCYVLYRDRIQYFWCWTYTHNFIIEIWVELRKLAAWIVHEWSVVKSIHQVILLNRWNVWLHPLSIIQDCYFILITCKADNRRFNYILYLNSWNWLVLSVY